MISRLGSVADSFNLRSVLFPSLSFFILLLVGMPGSLNTVHAVTVEPGQPSTLEVQTPSSAKAGKPFKVTIIVRDGQGNRVTNYDEMDRQIVLSSTGEGDLSVTSVSSKQFTNGEITIPLKYKVSENIQILAREKGHVAAGQSEEIQVLAGPPSSFNLSVPESARAGQPFTVTITVFDQFGNRVFNYRDQTNGVSFKTSGSETPKPSFIAADNFEDGRLKTKLTYEVAEEIQLVVADQVNGIQTVSKTIKVSPAPLYEFTVSLPQKARAGEPFKIAIEGRDRYGNIIRNYKDQGSGVDLTVPGGAKLEPSYVPPSKFEGGVAFIKAKYYDAGPIKIRVQDRGAAVEGESSRLVVEAGKLDSFQVDVPEEVRAGQKFQVTIKPIDAYGNVIRKFNQRGRSVSLGIRGSNASSKTISPDQFENGVAKTRFQHTSVGNYRLEARDRKTGNVTGESNSFTVIPGSPGKIEVDAPNKVQAGENFTAILRLQDQYGNDIKKTGNLSGRIRLSLMNSVRIDEKVLAPSHFIEGKKRVVFRHEEAETVAIFAEYRLEDVRNRSEPIRIVPGPFDHVSLSAPKVAQAGSKFPVNVELMDQYGNRLRKLPSGLNRIKLASSGDGDVEPNVITRAKMNGPSFTVDLKYYINETVSIQAFNSAGRKIGVTAPIKINPGPIESFAIQVPTTVTADEQFPLRLEAKDPYQNTITNLSEREGSISISSTGDSPVRPRQISFDQFVDGVVEIPVRYRKAERMKLVLESSDMQILTEQINVKPGDPVRFEVVTQETVQAGDPFPAVIKAFDQYGNLATNLSNDFYGVRLNSPGPSDISPGKISSKMFENGKANVFLAFARTGGSIRINASSLEKEIEHPIINRFFLDRKVGTGTLHVLGSQDLPANPQTSQDKNVQVSFKPANLAKGEQTENFQGWFLKKIRLQQDQFGKLPSVSLRVFARTSVRVQSTQDLNMFKMTVTTSVSEQSPTLRQIQSLIEDRKFGTATQKLDQYMKVHPNDQKAIQLRFRLQRLKEVLGQ